MAGNDGKTQLQKRTYINNFSIVGVAESAKMEKSNTGKDFARVRVAVTRTYQDKVFTTRVAVQVYGQDSANAANIAVGSIVWASGEAGAFIHEYQSKQYANLTLTGRIGLVTRPNAKEGDAVPEMSDKPVAAPRAAVAKPTPAAEVDDTDSIPF